MPTPSFHERASAKATVIKPDITHTTTTSPELGKTSCITSLKLCHNELVPRTESVVGIDKTPRRRLVTPAVPQPKPRTTMLCRPLNPEAPASPRKRLLNPRAPIVLYRRLDPEAKTYEPLRAPTSAVPNQAAAYPRDERGSSCHQLKELRHLDDFLHHPASQPQRLGRCRDTQPQGVPLALVLQENWCARNHAHTPMDARKNR